MVTVKKIEQPKEYIPKTEPKPIFKQQFDNEEIEYIAVAIDSHIKAYEPKAKSGGSKLVIKKFYKLKKKVEGLIR